MLPFDTPPKVTLDELMLPFILLPWCVTSLSEVISPSILESVTNFSFSTTSPLIDTSDSSIDTFSL